MIEYSDIPGNASLGEEPGRFARACRCLESVGVNVLQKPHGSPAFLVMIPSSQVLEADELKLRLDRIPPLRWGEDFDLS